MLQVSLQGSTHYRFGIYVIAGLGSFRGQAAVAHGDFIGLSGLLNLDSSAGLQGVSIAGICDLSEPYLLQIAKCIIVVFQSRKGSLCISDECAHAAT